MGRGGFALRAGARLLQGSAVRGGMVLPSICGVFMVEKLKFSRCGGYEIRSYWILVSFSSFHSKKSLKKFFLFCCDHSKN